MNIADLSRMVLTTLVYPAIHGSEKKTQTWPLPCAHGTPRACLRLGIRRFMRNHPRTKFEE